MVSRSPHESPSRPDLAPGVVKELGRHHHLLVNLTHASAAGSDPAAQLDRAGACLSLGAAAMGEGRLEEAAAAFRLALTLGPRCAEAYGGLAMIHQQRREYRSAVDMYLKCLELDGDNLVALLGLFQTCCQMGSFAKIIRCLEVYLRSHPNDVSVLFCLATLYARQGRLAEAAAVLDRVLALDPGKAEATELLAQVRAATCAAASSHGHRAEP